MRRGDGYVRNAVDLVRYVHPTTGGRTRAPSVSVGKSTRAKGRSLRLGVRPGNLQRLHDGGSVCRDLSAANGARDRDGLCDVSYCAVEAGPFCRSYWSIQEIKQLSRPWMGTGGAIA